MGNNNGYIEPEEQRLPRPPMDPFLPWLKPVIKIVTGEEALKKYNHTDFNKGSKTKCFDLPEKLVLGRLSSELDCMELKNFQLAASLGKAMHSNALSIQNNFYNECMNNTTKVQADCKDNKDLDIPSVNIKEMADGEFKIRKAIRKSIRKLWFWAIY